MVPSDTNHVSAKFRGTPNFFMVADLVEGDLFSQGVPVNLMFRMSRHGQHLAYFIIDPGTRDQVQLVLHAQPLEDGEEVQNLKVADIKGPGIEPVRAVMKGLLARFGGEWEERGYYDAEKIELEKIEKRPTERYQPTDRIKAAVELADSVRSSALVGIIARYGQLLAKPAEDVANSALAGMR